MSAYNINRFPFYKYELNTKDLWSIFGDYVPEKDVLSIFKKLDAFRSSQTWDECVDEEGKESKLIPIKSQKIKAIFSNFKGEYSYYGLEIKPSTIEKAGMGVFAAEDLPEGISAQYIGIPKSVEGYNPYYSWAVFPYNHSTGVAYRDGGDKTEENYEEEGESEEVEYDSEEVEEEASEEDEPKKYLLENGQVLSVESSVEDEDEVFDEEVASEDEEDDTAILYIDSSDPKTGNWTRTVNCNLDLEKNNIEVVQKFDHMYYKTSRPIKKGEELFCDYGEEYRLINIESAE